MLLFRIASLNKKKDKKKTKAKSNKNLLEKYKNELQTNFNTETKSGLNLLKVKKVRNIKANPKVTTFEKYLFLNF
jgi:uncharacterized membrane-anchored protein YhcB (DUF1043 family)